jgi:ATP-binding cassette subfamily B protein
VKENAKSASVWPVFGVMIAEMFHCTPVASALYCFCDVLHAAGYVLVAASSQYLFDGVAQVAHGAPILKAVMPLLLLALSTIFLEVTNGLSNFHIEYPSPKILSNLHQHLYEKAAKIPPAEFERPDFLDSLNKAQKSIEPGFFAASMVLMLFTFYLPYFIFMGIYLHTLSPFLIFALILIFIPVILGQIIRFKLFENMEDEIVPARRAMVSYEKAICDRDYFKETRLLGGFTYFIKLYRDAVRLVNRKTYSAEKRHSQIDLGLRLLTVAGYIGILIMLIRNLLGGSITAGAFAAVFASIGTMYNMAEEVFGDFFRRITSDAATIRNYQKFLEYPEQEGQAGTFDAQQGIILQNVHFQYPNADKEVLHGISLSIAQGETIAVVGENGAGKSTLMKLLLGLYLPTSGQVLIGGMDTSQIQSKDIYKNSSAVFQDYQRYRATLQENISVSQPQCNVSIEKIKDACTQAELDSSSANFPDGLKTILSREFGGTDLSGGQWQRVAIARGLYRIHNIIVLDEPTAAIDPIEETNLYRQFARLAKGKTAIIVTHRLGSARIADRIVVLKDGSIDDIGTHEQLIARQGFYAQLFRAQAKWYSKSAKPARP